MQELTDLLAQYGLALVFANVFLAQAGAPVPAVPLLLVAGALAAGGELPTGLVVAVAVAASLAGDALWFAAGRLHGVRVLRALCRVALEPDSCVRQTESIFERWGAMSLLFAKFVPGFATVAPPLAGAMRLNALAFTVYSALGAALWAGVAVGAGIVFAREVDWLLALLVGMGARAVAVLAALLALFVAFKWWERARFIRALRMARISVDELDALMQGGARPLVLDARSQAARRLDPRRIPGAFFLDPAAPGRRLAGVPVEHEVVVYCT